jgi:hypothetical protein
MTTTIAFGIGDVPAPPRVFVSSTFFDLRSIRQEIESHLKSSGFEPVLFESAAPLPNVDAPQSALRHASQADICLLIIGSRYGSQAGTDEPSWTHKEFRLARDLCKPVFTFIEQESLTKYELWRSLPSSDAWTGDERNLFLFIDEVSTFGSRFPFSTIADLKKTITVHFAAYFGYLLRTYSDIEGAAPNGATAWNSLGVRFSDRGECAKAVFCYRLAVAAMPDEPMFLNNLVANLKKVGKLAEAENEARRGAAKFPQYCGFQVQLCQILRDKGDLPGAEEAARELATRFPHDDRAWMAFASILRLCGKREEARAALRRVLNINPDNISAYRRFLDLGGDPMASDKGGGPAAKIPNRGQVIHFSPT